MNNFESVSVNFTKSKMVRRELSNLDNYEKHKGYSIDELYKNIGKEIINYMIENGDNKFVVEINNPSWQRNKSWCVDKFLISIDIGTITDYEFDNIVEDKINLEG